MSNNLKGAFLLTLSCLIMCLDNSIIHQYGFYHPTVTPAQIFLIKMSSSLLLVTAIILYKDPQLFKSKCLNLQITRAVFGAIGNFFWIKALSGLPLSFAVCLSMSSVFFNYIGSIILFKEALHPERLLCCIIGFLAIASSVKSEQIIFGIFAFCPLLSALNFSCASLIIKKVSQKDHVLTTLFYLLLTMTLLSLPSGVQQWGSISLREFLPLLSLGVFYFFAQVLLVSSYKIGEITFITPFKFAKIPINIIIGLMVFHEIPSKDSILPLTIIIISSIGLFASEWFKSKSNPQSGLSA